MKFFLMILSILLSFSSVQAQIKNDEQNQQKAEEIKNSPIIKYSRSIIPTNKDQKIARNIMVVREVVDFKMGDEKLAKYFDYLEEDKTYNKKLDKIFKKLKNDKRRDSKNQQIISILNDAGEKIYNIMSN